MARDSTRIATGTAVLGGTIVTDGATPRPVARVMVTITNTDRRSTWYAITDAQGHFQVSDLPGGRYSLVANRPGYLSTYYGASKPWRGPSVPISVADGERITDLSLTMSWGAVITGTIRDVLGQPMSGIRVQIMEPRTLNGERVLTPVFNVSNGLATNATDDRGIYRLYGVPPGSYVVGASATVTPGTRLTTAEEVEWARRQVGGPATTGPVGVGAASAPPDLGQSVGYGPVFYPALPMPALRRW